MNLPDRVYQDGTVKIGGNVIEAEYWRVTRVKPGHDVEIYLRPAGGDSAKDIIGTIAAVFLVIATAGIAAGVLAPVLGAGFAAGTLGASIASGVVGLAGQLVLTALFAPPVSEQPQQQQDDPQIGPGNRASIQDNIPARDRPSPGLSAHTRSLLLYWPIRMCILRETTLLLKLCTVLVVRTVWLTLSLLVFRLRIWTT